MGLSLEVGYLADRHETDLGAAEKFDRSLEKINQYLALRHLPSHNEPVSCPIFKVTLRGYSGFHYVQRMAAYLDLKGRLPRPGDDDSYKDPIIQEYYKRSRPNFFQKLLRKPGRKGSFDHLLFHSGCEGYYLPQDFADVLRVPDFEDEWAGMLGSSQRLMGECARIAEALNLPLDIDPDCDELWAEAASDQDTKNKWHLYHIESYTCLELYSAAEHSVKHGALLVFC